MSLNHVEPFHFATQLLTAWKDLVQTLHLPRQSLQKVATPAGSQALRIPRYGIQIQCFNMFQHVSMIFNDFQCMFHLHQVACFGFLYIQLELLVDDGHEL